MKKILIWILIICFALTACVLSGCANTPTDEPAATADPAVASPVLSEITNGDEDDGEDEDEITPETLIVGAWRSSESEAGLDYAFNADGTGTRTQAGGTAVAVAYEITGENTLTITYTAANGAETDDEYVFAVSETLLALTDAENVTTEFARLVD